MEHVCKNTAILDYVLLGYVYDVLVWVVTTQPAPSPLPLLSPHTTLCNNP
jgi:hypothetical protein